MTREFDRKGRGIITRLAGATRDDSLLVEENFFMGQAQRELEQKGHQQFAKVHVQKHLENNPASPEGELQNNIQKHPLLDTQKNDGISPNESPEPPLNSAARTEYDNALNEQKHQLQMRLGLSARTAPEFKP